MEIEVSDNTYIKLMDEPVAETKELQTKGGYLILADYNASGLIVGIEIVPTAHPKLPLETVKAHYISTD